MTSAGKIGKVLGAGSAILDLLVRTPDDFIQAYAGGEKGGMNLLAPEPFRVLREQAARTAPLVRMPGGSAANTLCGLVRLGIPSALFGKIGRDEAGEFYRNAFAAIGGDTGSFKVNPDQPTGCCLSIVTPDSERTMRTCLGASGTLIPEEVTDADFDGVTHLHVEGYLLYNTPVFRRLLDTAKAHGCSVSFDLSSFEVVRQFRGELAGLLDRYVDLVFANEDEAREFAGGGNPRSALDELAKHCDTAVVKLGRQGAVIRRNGKDTEVGAELVQAIDTTGAGDLWQAGFLYGWLRGKSPEYCGQCAALTAAEVVQVMGAQIPDVRWDALRARFAAMDQQA